MHNALSFQRVHQPKNHTTAIYHPETNMAFVNNPKGTHFAKMGNILSAEDSPFGNDPLRGQRMWLLPEEVLYLLERGTLDVRWPGVEGEEDEGGLPMSLQGAYAMFITSDEMTKLRSHSISDYRMFDARRLSLVPSRGPATLTLERYSVYAGLKRMGYTVLRAPSWDSPGPPAEGECFAPSPQRTWQVGLLNLDIMWDIMTTKAPENEYRSQREGPLVEPKLYRSYADIYRRLALIRSYDPTTRFQPFDQELPDTDPAFRITYHVWKPGSQTFKKSAPGSPDFRIAVINARETSLPTCSELSALLETVPYDPPSETGQLYQKLKHGYKSVILAIVDQGVVSYLRVADAAFGKEKLYERKGKGPGGKRGGRSNRGRGR